MYITASFREKMGSIRMPFYESTFIARQDISSQDVDQITDQFAKVVSDLGGKVMRKESWGLRNLAYQIGKNRKGHYVMLSLKASADTVKELQRQYKLSEDVIRNLTVKVSNINNEPSPMARKDHKDK